MCDFFSSHLILKFFCSICLARQILEINATFYAQMWRRQFPLALVLAIPISSREYLLQTLEMGVKKEQKTAPHECRTISKDQRFVERRDRKRVVAWSPTTLYSIRKSLLQTQLILEAWRPKVNSFQEEINVISLQMERDQREQRRGCIQRPAGGDSC